MTLVNQILRSHYRRKIFVYFPLAAFLLTIFVPHMWLNLSFNQRIFSTPAHLPPLQYGIVFGARVNDDFSLTDVTRERVEAAILLYQQGIITKLYVSGDNRHNQEAATIANYAQMRGVVPEDIVIDPLGIDTHDTCRHFAQLAHQGILLTQAFHLPRAMLMCEREGVSPIGLAVNRLDILSVRGHSVVEIYATRTWRYIRESFLTWAFILGIYDVISNDAEKLESDICSLRSIR